MGSSSRRREGLLEVREGVGFELVEFRGALE